jgi:hypothetical protein
MANRHDKFERLKRRIAELSESGFDRGTQLERKYAPLATRTDAIVTLSVKNVKSDQYIQK